MLFLLVLCIEASWPRLASDPSKLSLLKPIFLSTPANKAGGQDRTFDSLDSAYCEMFVEVQIDRTDFRCSIGGDLCLNLWGALEVLLHRGMQPPLLPHTYQRGASRLGIVGQFATSETHFEPTPTASCPDFEQDG